ILVTRLCKVGDDNNKRSKSAQEIIPNLVQFESLLHSQLRSHAQTNMQQHLQTRNTDSASLASFRQLDRLSEYDPSRAGRESDEHPRQCLPSSCSECPASSCVCITNKQTRAFLYFQPTKRHCT